MLLSMRAHPWFVKQVYNARMDKAKELSAKRADAGRNGGKARAEALSATRRREIAREGALARWADHQPPAKRKRARRRAGA
jgi:hypothetical protein